MLLACPGAYHEPSKGLTDDQEHSDITTRAGRAWSLSQAGPRECSVSGGGLTLASSPAGTSTTEWATGVIGLCPSS